jgi:epoxyqueuosine reductase
MEDYLPLNIVKELAIKEGFCDCGAAMVEKIDISYFNNWLANGYNASMQYLERYLDKREDISLLVPNSKTVFCFLMSYNDEDVTKDYTYHIASYAQRKDYHYIIKNKLNNIITSLQLQFPNLQAIAFIDTAPILEKQWAVQCGLGWIGKNSLLTTQHFGNKVFIGEIICNFYSDYTQRIKDYCGSCHSCVDSCPNKAIKEDKTIDCNICISYQTIENKNIIDRDIDLKNYIYGCDICLNSCMWNNKAMKIKNQDDEVKTLVCNSLNNISKECFTEKDFQLLRKQSPMNRIKYNKFLSNIGIVKQQLKKVKK